MRFPEGVHSHTREQRFYFGSDGLLRRHDYAVDVWADFPAAHFLSDYVDVDGLKYPTHRSVFGIKKDGTLDLEFNAVAIALSDYALFRELTGYEAQGLVPLVSSSPVGWLYGVLSVRGFSVFLGVIEASIGLRCWSAMVVEFLRQPGIRRVSGALPNERHST